MRAKVWDGEGVHGLLFDDDLLRAVDREIAGRVGHDYAVVEQGGFGFVLAGGAGDAVREARI